MQPAIAPNGTLTFTTALNANGAATVSVQLHDNGGTALNGHDTSPAQTFTITLNAVNDQPSFVLNPILAGGLTLPEDGPQANFTIASSTNPGAPDEVTQTLTFSITNNTNPGLITAAINGPTLSLTTTPGQSGSGSISIRVQDNGGTANGGVDTSASQTFTVTVVSVNDAPSFTLIAAPNQTVNEDVGAQGPVNVVASSSPGPPDEAGQVLNYIVTNNNNGLFSGGGQPAISPTGNLTYTPAPDANGTAIISVAIHDNGGTAFGGIDTSPTQTFTIAVNAVNDAPVNTLPAAPLILEDVQTPIPGISIADPDSGTPAIQVTVSITVSAGTLDIQTPSTVSVAAGPGNLLLSGPLNDMNTALAALKFTGPPNAIGPINLQVITSDQGNTGSGGTLLDTDNLALTITPVNDAPSFTLIAAPNQTVNEDDGAQAPGNVINSFNPGGGADEAGQTPTYLVTNNNNSLFSSQPAIAPNGNLTYTPAANANGIATVTVRVQDSGGTANGGVDTSPLPGLTFTITVLALNDAPVGTPSTVVTGESTARAFLVADFGFTDPNDSPPNTFARVKLTTLPGAGTITLTGFPAPAAGDFITVAQINGGLLVFTPAANANGSPYTTFTFQVEDNGATGGGNVNLDATPRLLTINVTPVNTPPTGTDILTLINEDQVYTFAAANFGFSDAGDNPSPNNFLAVKITTLPSAGTLAVTGGPVVTAGSFVTVSDINANKLTYTPVLNFNGSPDPSFTFQVQDDGGSLAGSDLDPTPNTFSFTVQPLNDAPVGQDNTVNAIEDTEYTFIAANFPMTDPSDTPQNNFAGVVLSTLPSPAQGVLRNAAAVPYSAGAVVTLAQITGGDLRFMPAANVNGTGAASFTFQVFDDGAFNGANVNTDQSPNTFSFNITAVNDAPDFVVGANKVSQPNTVESFPNFMTGITPGGGADEATQTLTFNVTGNTNATIFAVAPAVDGTGPNLGRLTYTTNAVSGTSTISVQLVDSGPSGGANVNSSAVKTFTINNNGPPVITDMSVSTPEGTMKVITLSASDVEGTDSQFFINGAINPNTVGPGTAHGLLITPQNYSCTGTLPSPRVCTIDVTYWPTDNSGNYYGPDSFTYTATDGTSTSGAKTVSITVTPVNDAPQVSSNATPQTYTENASPVVIYSAITLSDVENDQIASGFVQLAPCGAGNQDVLAYPSNIGSITQLGLYNAGTCTLSLIGTDSLANWQTALASVTYFNNSDDPTGGTRTATFSVTDNGTPSAATGTGTRGITVTPVNDAPALALVSANATYTEDQPAVNVLTSATITDADDANMGSAFIQITGNCEAADLLSYTTALGITAGVYQGFPACSLTLTGNTTKANWQTALANVKFSNTSQNPSILQRTISFTVTDAGASGAAQTSSPAQTATVNVVAVNDAPVAVTDTFSTGILNNTEVKVGTSPTCGSTPCTTLSGNLMANDTDPEKPSTQCTGANGCTLTAQSKKSTVCTAQGANCPNNNVVIASDGTFTYVSSPGQTGADSFTYTLHDNDSSGDLTATGTVNITVDTQKVWYVNASSAAPGTPDGTSMRPFTALTPLATGGASDSLDGTGDIIFVYQGTYEMNPLSDGLQLEDGQRLWGQPFGLVVGATTLVSSGTGTNPLINNSSLTGAGITFRNSSEVQRVNVSNTGGAGYVSSGPADAFIVGPQTSVTRTGGAAFQLSGSPSTTGTIDFGATITNDQATNGRPIDIQNRTGALGGTVNFTGAITGNGQGVLLNNNPSPYTVNISGGMTLSTGANQAFSAAGTAVLNMTGTNNITTTTANPITLSNTTIGSNGVTFAAINTSALGGANAGISLSGVTGSGTFNVQGGTVTANSSDDALSIFNGSAPMTIATNFSQAGSGKVVQIDNHETNNITVSGTLSGTSANRGIVVNNVNSSTITFSGSSKSINTSATAAVAAVTVTNNGGANVNFTNGNLVLQSSSGAGFTATGGATAISVQGTGNTITSTTGTALNVNSTTISASGLTFQSITSNGAGSANGIILDTTGSNAGLTVSGSGTPASGGTISNKTGGTGSTTQGTGIYLNSTVGISLDRMQLNDFSNFAIKGSNVTGFSLTNSVINGTNGDTNAGGSEEGSIRFDNLTTSVSFPTAQITGSSISGGGTFNVWVLNTTGGSVLNRLVLNNNTFGLISSTIGNDNVDVTARPVAPNTATLNVTLTNNTFLGTKSDFFEATADGISTMDVIARVNKFTSGQAITPGGGVGVSLRGDVIGTADVMTFDVSCNNIVGAVAPNQANAYDTVALFVAKGNGSGTWSGAIVNNAIGPARTSPSLANADGIFIRATGSGSITTLVQNNVLSGYGNNGIHIQNNDGSVTTNATLYGNTESSPNAQNFAGLFVDNGGTATDTVTANVVVGSAGNVSQQNTFAGVAIGVSLSNFNSATHFNLYKNGSASGTVAGVIQDDNVGTPTVDTSGGVGPITLVAAGLPPVPATPASCSPPP